jgi:aminomethyltransferase
MSDPELQSTSAPDSASPPSEALRTTALHALHLELGGRMVPFAGYDMPVQYEGVITEHTATRTSAALFDVSHMGIVDLWPTDGASIDDVAVALEQLVPASVTGIKVDRLRYSMLTNESGGVIDDLMITRFEQFIRLVVNAGRKDADVAHLCEHLLESDPPAQVDLRRRDDLTLLALQGPLAVDVLSDIDSGVSDLVFMQAGNVTIDGTSCEISRSGYTGEDGFEIAMPIGRAEAIARILLADSRVSPAGLGARDTLRLEAGLCLYGHELAEDINPVEADLVWSIQKRRRTEGGFLGDDVILDQIETGPELKRVGIRPVGKRPIRDDAQLSTEDGKPAGVITSGGFGPTLNAPIAMAFVETHLAVPGQKLVANVRDKLVECVVAELPFVPHRYVRSTGK